MEKRQELWDAGSRANKENKKIAFAHVTQMFEDLVENSINNLEDFVYEGHFTNDETWEVPKRFRAAGFSINMIFFGLRDTNLSELRVVNRANEGGHYVDPAHLAANFYGNLEKLNINYHCCPTKLGIKT